jgi:tRNA pseudouridine55 synthase
MDARGGIILVDKPAGVTSFGVVNRVRRNLIRAYPELSPPKVHGGGPRPPKFKCGHAGTLDPSATGLLLVLVGRSSRLAPFLLGLSKSYAATVRFGLATDTLDAEGEVTARAPYPSLAAIETHLDDFRGDIMQVPPVISALKRDGRALYERVRAGEVVAEPDARPVTIGRLDLTATRPDPADSERVAEADLIVDCTSGTYIRSLARDVAQAAGSEGHLDGLRRLTIGPFRVEDAITGVMDTQGEDLAEAIRPAAEALPHLPGIMTNDEETARILQGGQPEPAWLERLDGPLETGKNGELFRILDPGGELLAVGRMDEESGEPKLAAVIAVTGGMT